MQQYLRVVLTETNDNRDKFVTAQAHLDYRKSDLDALQDRLEGNVLNLDEFIARRLTKTGLMKERFKKPVDDLLETWISKREKTTLDSVDQAVQQRPDIVTSLFQKYNLATGTDVKAIARRMDQMDIAIELTKKTMDDRVETLVTKGDFDKFATTIEKTVQKSLAPTLTEAFQQALT